MNFIDAKAVRDVLDAEVARTGNIVGEIADRQPKTAMGLTPDAIKFSPEYRSAKAAYDQAFARLRAFNGFYTKTFKAEIRAERDARKSNSSTSTERTKT